ncbi:hypothetical protein OIU74_001541 [Salix koriyanagi]|uniref:R13L1/DRL21-like LRR repeat region domain-containing protein n=1 Tax=Salix koriyanagi TaxID=2511006 RepID=A0A9Q0X559_9ROSI|nr:hypothetical protein OIU74_001541 [Salix koriyanagi]
MAFVEAITSAILQPLIEKLASASFLKFDREKEKEKEINSEIKKWELSYRRRSSKLRKNLVPTCFAAGIGKVGWSKLEDITSRLQEIVAQKDLLDLSKCSFSRFDERLPTTSLMVKKSHVYGREKDKEALVELLIRGGEAANGSPFSKSSANNVRYVMHDLISELAQFVSREVCFHLGDKLEDSQSYAKVRYSSFTRHRYDISQRFEVFYEMKSLRTFLPLPIFSPSYNYLTRKVLHDLVPNLKRLAVLSLAGYCLLELPSSICALKHLRYLNLSYTEIEVLPESLCEVFRLQTLRLRGCKKLIKLPIGIDNLINLQYLDISGTDSLQEMPPQIGNLTNLHTLPKFIIGKGLGIRELMKLSHLQGQLNITGLHNVVDVRDTELAILKEKRGLSELSLEWIHNVIGFQSEARELQLLSLLEPHQNLQKLSIMSYGGTAFPSWLGDHSFSNMVCLQLCECHKTTSLPSLGQLPVLRDLSIKGMERVTTIGAEFLGVGSSVKAFPSLEGLIIEDMLNWKQWSWSNGLNQEEAGEFSNLRELTIINCPMLVGMLPCCLLSVKKLSICNCPQLVALPESLPYLCELIVEGCNVAILNHMPVMPSLTTLKVVSITGLVSLCRDFLQALVALEDLEIENCNDLMYLWQDGTDLRELASMKHLEIKKFEQFVSLVELEIPGDLEQLPSGLQCLGSLRNLKIDHCPKLVSLPEGLPYSLQHLEISHCDLLKSMPDGMVIMMNGCKSNQCLLEELLISWCPSLKSIPIGLFPITLKSLAISWCTNLKNLLGGIVYNGDGRRELSYLEHLTIEGLPRLLFPAFELPLSLKTLEIGYCTMQSLESLCDLSHLTELEISGCSMLESFPEMGLTTPNLISLSIWKCENLRSLPNHMDCLVSLQELSVNHCYSLVSFSKGGLPPNLIEFEIRYCENITESMSDWGLHTLIFLKRLVIECTSPCTNMVSFPDDEGQFLPTSLTTLYILSLKGLKSISKGLKCLMSLEILMISDCPKLCFFPKEGFPGCSYPINEVRIYLCNSVTMMVVELADCYKFLLIESEQENQKLSANLCWFWRHKYKRILKTGPGTRREGVVKQINAVAVFSR